MLQYLKLTPAYQKWCKQVSSDARDMVSYTAYLARVDHLLCYMSILYPTFVNKDDFVFRKDSIPNDWDGFMNQARAGKWSKREIEYMVNHLHVTDLFINDPDVDNIQLEVYQFLADTVADLWQKRLEETFPDRRFEVGIAERDSDPEVYVVEIDG